MRKLSRAKRLVAAEAGVITVLLGLAAPASGYQQQMQTASERLGAAMTNGGRKSLAVVDFTDLQGNATELGRFLAEQLSVAMGAGADRFEVIDRNHLRAILQEHKLSATGLIDPQTARKLGQIAGAECLASGSITPFSESVNVSIKLLDTNTAKILGGVTIDIPRTSTINELLAKGISTGAASTPTAVAPKTAPAAGAETNSAVSGTAFGVAVSISECKKTGDSVSCHGTLRNDTDKTLHVNFLPWSGVEVVDNLGNQWHGRAYLGSSGQWELELEPDLPVRFWLNDVAVAAEATSITARVTVGVKPSFDDRRVGGFSGNSASGGQKVVLLRSIPLR